MKHIQNKQKKTKIPYQLMDFKNLEKKSTNQNFPNFYQMFVNSKKKTIP